jgi:Ca2+-binding RTX toxin-like protein
MANVYGDGGNNVLVGTSGNDEIWGMGGDDVLIGSGGHDTLNGGTGADTMDGGSGDDTYVVDSSGDQVVEYAGGGNDTVRSSITYSLQFTNVETLVLTGSANLNGFGVNGKNDNLYGNSGNNVLFGYTGNDYLSGGAGDDTLNGGYDADTMVGGTGDDLFYVDNAGDVVIEYASQGIDTVAVSIANYTLGANFENLILLSGAGNTAATGNSLNNHITGNDYFNWIDGGAGMDTMAGGGGNDTYYVDHFFDTIVEDAGEGTDWVYSSVTRGLEANVEWLILTGTANNSGYGNSLDNVLQGNSGNNSLFGNGGHDTLIGNGGNDNMHGGTGDDTFHVDETGDQVFENANEGWDTVYASIDYTLLDHFEALTLSNAGNAIYATGNSQNNEIFGNEYDNVIDGGTGLDLMAGDGGNDIYTVDHTIDSVVEEANEGYDTVFSSVNYQIADHIEVLSLAGGTAVSGTGNAQSNTIYGNAGNNVLNGGGGADDLSGLGGNDTFVFQAGQANGDKVYEFEGNGAGAGDLLQFSGYGTAAQGATLTQQGADTWLITSFDGAIQETITLVGAPTLHQSDYLFV